MRRTLIVTALLLTACPASEPAPKAPAPPPAVAEAGDWCGGHGLPESMCTKCNPELVEAFEARGDWCAEHGFPESACPICNPMEPPAGVEEAEKIPPGTRIRFAAPEVERDTGVAVVGALRAAMHARVECTARVDFNQNRLADIRAPVPGVVRRVRVDLGEAVPEAGPLFVLESPRVGDLQGRIRAARQRLEVARADHQRQLDLRASNIASDRQVELARQELEAAEADLTALESSLRIAGAPNEGQRGRYTLRSPLAGTVVRRPATVGTFATEETSLATVADTSTMWAMLDIREVDAPAVRVGQSVRLTLKGLPGRAFEGTLTWVASEVDPRTRTVSARAEVDNPDGVLRAHQFARAEVAVSASDEAVAVPTGAVQRLDEQRVVFVRTGEGLYEPRVVRVGRARRGLTQITGDVEPGDPVVTDGAFLLRTELEKDSIGAGCCEVEGPGAR